MGKVIITRLVLQLPDKNIVCDWYLDVKGLGMCLNCSCFWFLKIWRMDIDQTYITVITYRVLHLIKFWGSGSKIKITRGHPSGGYKTVDRRHKCLTTFFFFVALCLYRKQIWISTLYSKVAILGQVLQIGCGLCGRQQLIWSRTVWLCRLMRLSSSSPQLI